jgi:hypothetical protein
MGMKNKLRCFYCGKLYATEKKARECENNHDVVFVPILREDLNRLINFIATGDRTLLSERLSRTLFRYFRSESPK